MLQYMFLVSKLLKCLPIIGRLRSRAPISTSSDAHCTTRVATWWQEQGDHERPRACEEREIVWRVSRSRERRRDGERERLEGKEVAPEKGVWRGRRCQLLSELGRGWIEEYQAEGEVRRERGDPNIFGKFSNLNHGKLAIYPFQKLGISHC